MNEAIFQEADEQVKLIQEILDLASKYFPNTYTPTVLFLQGLTVYHDVVVPIESISHKMIFESFDKTFFDAFKSLFNKVYKEKESFTSEFAFRTTIDLGVENSFLLYDPRVEKNDKDRFILFSLMADYYSFKNKTDFQFQNEFNKFIKDYGNLLTEKEKLNLEGLLEYKDENEHSHNVKNIRMISGSIRDSLINKYVQKKIFNKGLNLVMLNSGLSHTLHGNVFLVDNMLKETSYQNHLFRVYANLFITGMEFLKNFCGLANDIEFTKVVNSFIFHNNEFRKKFDEAWVNQPKERVKLEIVTK